MGSYYCIVNVAGSDVNDFKLDDFFAAPVEFFEPHYGTSLLFFTVFRDNGIAVCGMFVGVNGARGDGDITNADNLTAFREFVLSETDNKGVHFVMGDGVGHCHVVCFILKLVAFWLSLLAGFLS